MHGVLNLRACLGQCLQCFSAENAEKSRQTLRFQRAYSSRMRRRNAGFELGGKKSQKRARGRVALIPLALIAHAVPNRALNWFRVVGLSCRLWRIHSKHFGLVVSETVPVWVSSFVDISR